MKNRSHHVIYFDSNQLIHTTPKEWARQHEGEFSKFDFKKKMPTTDVISDYLIKKHGFTRIESENRVITIHL